MPSVTGYNVILAGDYDLPKLTGVLTRLPPSYHLLMDNSAAAQGIVASHRRHTFVWRRWPDGDLHNTTDPVAWVNEMASYMPDPAAYLYAGNEPGYTARLASWTVSVIHALDRIRRAGVVVNGGMGGPERKDWLNQMRPILEALHTSNRWRREQGLPLHALGLHEYADFGDWRAPGYDPLKGETWLIGRCTWLVEVCAQLGLDVPPIWITEHGMDSLQARYHGWKVIPLSELQYANEQLIPMNNYYRDQERRHGMTVWGPDIFTWIGGGLGWDTFQVKNADVVHERNIQHQQQIAQQEYPSMDNWQTGTIEVLAKSLRVRSGPGMSWPQIGSLARTDGPVPAQIGAEAAEGGYTWVHIKTAEIEGWAATGEAGGETYLAFTIDADPPQEPPPVVDPPEEPDDLAARVAALEAENVAIRADQDNLRTTIRSHYRQLVTLAGEAADSIAAESGE